MATYVLVHGAWHGGWCWRNVAPALRRAGHDVYAPSLTGHGERKHLAGPHVDLEMHIEDVVSLVEMEDLRDIVLVGHSYGGMVVTGASDRLQGRIRHLVYLDAFVPENGKCLMDYVFPDRGARMAVEGEKSGMVTPPPMSVWGLEKPEHLAFVGPREVKHSYATMKQPLRLSNPAAWAKLPKTYVFCSSPATGSFDQYAERFRHDPAWRFFDLPTGHDAMILMPEETTQIFLGAAN